MDSAVQRCRLCEDQDASRIIERLRSLQHGYKHCYRELKASGFEYSRAEVQVHTQHVPRNILSGIEDAVARASVEVDEDWFADRGIQVPEGVKWVAATVTEMTPEGKPVWLRVKPETEDLEERIEIRQAQPVVIEAPRLVPSMFVKRTFQAWAVIPDCQIGYWVDHEGNFHSTHDETCFSLGHQIMRTLAESEGLHGILDVGDLVDLSCMSRWNPTAIDLSVAALNKTWQRTSDEMAARRWLVGEEGEVVVLSGNHDFRAYTSLTKAAPWLIGMQRPGDPEEWPVLSVPFMVRAKEHLVEWCENFPSSYRKLNGNLVAMHSPALGTKPFDTAKRIAQTIHASVVHGHSHRSESANFNLETTDKGVRTFSVFSSGCWARIDGSLPSGKNSFDSFGNRLLATNQNSKMGMLSENFHQGMDILWVEQGGREMWSREHIDFWGGWAQWRGMEFNADCDQDGESLAQSDLAA